MKRPRKTFAGPTPCTGVFLPPASALLCPDLIELNRALADRPDWTAQCPAHGLAGAGAWVEIL